VGGKWLALLREIAPGVMRVAVVRDTTITSGREVSSRAMRRLFEQRAVLAGRRPPVGRRCIVDGGAEL
jgi:hypothetical protein